MTVLTHFHTELINKGGLQYMGDNRIFRHAALNLENADKIENIAASFYIVKLESCFRHFLSAFFMALVVDYYPL